MKWPTVMAAAALLLSAAAQPRPQDGWPVSSPDGRTEIRVTRGADGALQYRVARDGHIVLDDSPLGIRRADAALDTRLTYVSGTDVRNIDDRYTLPHGKRKDHHVIARERTLTLTNTGGARLEIALRAQNDGVAFRYRFPESAAAPKTVVEEMTGFSVPRG